MFDFFSEPFAGSRDALSAAVNAALGKEIDGGTSFSDTPDERFTRELRESVYDVLQLKPNQIDAIEQMVAEAPTRRPGKGALNNLITLFPSHKNGGQRWLESHTVERLLAYKLERDPDVLGYVTQVQCRRVCRKVSKGIHVSNPVLDFLVFYRDRIVLIECKTEEKLFELSEKKPEEWVLADGAWKSIPHQEFAEPLGMQAEVFASSRLFATELQNAELVHSELCADELATVEKLGAEAQALLAKQPLTIAKLAELVPGFTNRTAARMLAKGSAYGLERIIALSESDRFLLFASKSHQCAVDEGLWSVLLDETAELCISDRLLLASPARVDIAKKRWDRLQAIQRGEQPRTFKMDKLWRVVSKKIAQGESPIEACLSDHDRCGNRGRRLVQGQIEALEERATKWSKGEFFDRTQAWLKLEALCARHGVATPHSSTLNREIRKEKKSRRTLMVDGLRQFQKEKDRTDGSKCSLPSLAFGHTLIVDSSNFDRRIAKNLLTKFESAVPRFYAGIDGATEHPMAHALLFGPARTDGLAILMREFVRRHGFLPRIIQLDRGSENTGQWIKDFAKHFGIELRWTPTGGSRYNGTAENVIGRINHNVAHQGPGSTLPDQRGRATDGRLKSRKTACQAFEDIVGEFEAYFYDELPFTRNKDDISAADRREYAIETCGTSGLRCALDDAMCVLTSLEIDVPKTVVAARGIRLTEGAYSGTALGEALRNNHITELRKDCAHPSVVYARVGRRWYRAFRRDCQVMLGKRPTERLFHLLNEPFWRSQRSCHNLDQRRAREQKREAEMSAALHGKEALVVAPAPEKQKPETKTQKAIFPAIDWTSLKACKVA